MSEVAVRQPSAARERDLTILRLNGDIDLGNPPKRIPHDKLPIAVLQWLAAKADGSLNTADAYHRAISAWLAWCLCAEPIVDPHDAWLSDAEAWKRYMTGQGLAERTVNQRVAACSSLYRRLLAEDKVARNPFEALKRNRVETDDADTPALADSHALRVIEQAEAEREHVAHRAVLELLLSTGARASEIANANLSDLGADELGPVLRVRRKGGKKQGLPVTGDAVAALDAANGCRKDLADPNAPLLRSPKGGRYSRHTISRLVARYAKAALNRTEDERKLAKLVTAHTTRRTAATLLADDNVDLRTIQTLLGHADPRTTEGYIRAKNDRRKHIAAASVLASKLRK